MNPILRSLVLWLAETAPACILEAIIEALIRTWNDYIRMFELPFDTIKIVDFYEYIDCSISEVVNKKYEACNEDSALVFGKYTEQISPYKNSDLELQLSIKNKVSIVASEEHKTVCNDMLLLDTSRNLKNEHSPSNENFDVSPKEDLLSAGDEQKLKKEEFLIDFSSDYNTLSPDKSMIKHQEEVRQISQQDEHIFFPCSHNIPFRCLEQQNIPSDKESVQPKHLQKFEAGENPETECVENKITDQSKVGVKTKAPMHQTDFQKFEADKGEITNNNIFGNTTAAISCNEKETEKSCEKRELEYNPPNRKRKRKRKGSPDQNYEVLASECTQFKTAKQKNAITTSMKTNENNGVNLSPEANKMGNDCFIKEKRTDNLIDISKEETFTKANEISILFSADNSKIQTTESEKAAPHIPITQKKNLSLGDKTEAVHSAVEKDIFGNMHVNRIEAGINGIKMGLLESSIISHTNRNVSSVFPINSQFNSYCNHISFDNLADIDNTDKSWNSIKYNGPNGLRRLASYGGISTDNERRSFSQQISTVEENFHSLYPNKNLCSKFNNLSHKKNVCEKSQSFPATDEIDKLRKSSKYNGPNGLRRLSSHESVIATNEEWSSSFKDQISTEEGCSHSSDSNKKFYTKLNELFRKKKPKKSQSFPSNLKTEKPRKSILKNPNCISIQTAGTISLARNNFSELNKRQFLDSSMLSAPPFNHPKMQSSSMELNGANKYISLLKKKIAHSAEKFSWSKLNNNLLKKLNGNKSLKKKTVRFLGKDKLLLFNPNLSVIENFYSSLEVSRKEWNESTLEGSAAMNSQIQSEGKRKSGRGDTSEMKIKLEKNLSFHDISLEEQETTDKTALLRGDIETQFVASSKSSMTDMCRRAKQTIHQNKIVQTFLKPKNEQRILY